MAITWRVPGLCLLGIIACIFRPELSTVWFWFLGLLFVMFIDYCLAPSGKKLQLQRGPNSSVKLGDSTKTQLLVTNPTKRKFRILLRDAWYPSAGTQINRHRLQLRSGQTENLATTLIPTRRGNRISELVTIRSFGPLQLAAKQTSVSAPQTVRVTPAFPSRKHLPSRLARLQELDGRAAIRVRGQGTEFDSLREYVPGDDVRSIDWRASARNRSVVVRTWQPERDRRIVIILDTGRTSAARIGDVPRLDIAMDAVQLITALALRAGDRVDFIAGDRKIRTVFSTKHHAKTLGVIQDQMADLEPALAETNWHQIVTALQNLGRQRALVVLLTSLEPSVIEYSLLPYLSAITKRHRLLIGSVRDGEVKSLSRQRDNAREVYTAAAAEQNMLSREKTARMLTALGVQVLDSDSDQSAVNLADCYLELKAKGLL